MSGLARKLMAAAGGVEKLYVDDVFSTWLRTGTGADATVSTGIDMTKGYMLWSKGRSGATDHAIYDSARGVTFDLASNNSAAQTNQATGLKAVSATGHTVGSLAKMNTSGATYVDWVFRKSPKFFDVVTYTGSGGSRELPHDLDSSVGMVIVKNISSTTNWYVCTRAGYKIYLNTAQAEPAFFNGIAIGGVGGRKVTVSDSCDSAGDAYVAYIFAHDTSVDGIIQCGAYTTDGGGKASVNLGWEPQYVLSKVLGTTGNWIAVDSIRGMPVGSADALLYPNLSNAEASAVPVDPTATGFNATGLAASQTYIYLAIRRPNKQPKTGAEVYGAVARTGTGDVATVTAGFPVDLAITKKRSSSTLTGARFTDRLRGKGNWLDSSATTAETSTADTVARFDAMTGVVLGADSTTSAFNTSAHTYVDHFFRRAPGFMDVVCYTGTGVARTIAHTLAAVPELVIVKKRNNIAGWPVYHAGMSAGNFASLHLASAMAADSGKWNNTPPTASVFSLGTDGWANTLNDTYVAYLFATLAGISKVGSYTGNGSSQTIDCGFSTGARFVLIKRTDATGDWYVWDTARGIVAANDPHLSLNTTAAEVTTDDSIDPAAAGFVVNQNAATNINVNAGNYIFLAIA